MIDFQHLQSCVFSHERHANDSMFHGDEPHYIGVAESFRRVAIASYMSRAQTAGGGTVSRILDFGCGYGRVTRILRAMFPAAEIVAADLAREGVDYCRDSFGCTPYYASTDISALDLTGAFDLIWLGSVITHLPQDKSRRLLGYLSGKLSPDALLCVSSHGRFCATRAPVGGNTPYGLEPAGWKRVLADLRSGYGYADYPNQQGYGISVIDPRWFHEIAASNRLRICYFGEAVWDAHHDVVTFQNRAI